MRQSVVNSVRILSNQLSSIILVGDSAGISAESRVLAVQRKKPQYLGNEGDDLLQFRIFRQDVPEPKTDESFSFRSLDESPAIRVGDITIYGLSTAAVLQIGSTCSIDLENRTKHIRQLPSGRRPV
jgi:spore germination protein PE